MNRFLASLVCFGAAFLFAAGGAASAKEVIRFATHNDPVFMAAVYPIMSGKVSSDLVEVEIAPLGIPGLNQAPATREYDVIHCASLSVPRALDQGLPMTVIAISLRYPKSGDGANVWVSKDSEYQTIEDLRGKTIGTYGLNTGGFTNVRQILELKYGFNADLEDGDFTFVELPAPALPAALNAGRIDAATFVHAQIFQAKQAGDFRPILKVQDELYEHFDVQIPSLVLAAYTDRVSENPEVYKAFLELLRDSMAYLHENSEEVFEAVGAEHDIDPAYFRMWFDEFGEIPYAVTEDDIVALQKSWDASEELGVLDEAPDARSAVWTGGIVD